MPKRKPGSSHAVYGGALIVLLILALLVLTGVLGGGTPGSLPDSTAPPDTNLAQTGDSALPQADGDWYSLYFTSPGSPESSELLGGPDEALAAAIAGARLSVDMAAYDMDLYRIRDALLDAHRRGIRVRVVTDSDYLDEEALQAIQEEGIPLLGDRREGSMHNKFVVIDRQEVWTGSMNFTVNDAYRNNNNLIRIRSLQLSEDYTVEFEEMFEGDLFGSKTLAATLYPAVIVDGTQVEIFFSPDDGTARRLVELLGSAQHSICFLAYSFTSDELANAVIERAKAGVSVAGVMEETQVNSNQGSEYLRFRKAGLDVRLDGNPRNMHHKVLIVDGRIVVTGSYNFSSNAEKTNDENTLIIHHAGIAGKYLDEFESIFEEAKSK